MNRMGIHGTLAALAMLLPVAALRGDDDTVVDAAAERLQEQPAQQIPLDQQMNCNFFPVECDAEKSRQECLGRLLLQVSALDLACGLLPAQRRKCEAAAKLEVARMMDEIEPVRQRYSGRTLDLRNPAHQAEWQRFQQDIQAVRSNWLNVGGETSLLHRTIAGILDDEQRSEWRRESDLRLQYQWQGVVDAGMVQIDFALGLTDEQHEAIRALLLEKPLRIDAAQLWGQGNHFAPLVCRYGLTRIDRARLETIVNKWQREMLAQCIEQGKSMAGHLKQQKVIRE